MPDEPNSPTHDPADEQWLEDFPEGELPHRPRRRLFGAGGHRAGGHPIPLALTGVLLIACGFIGGVLVEKGQSPSSPSAAGSASGLASRFAALRATGGASGGRGTPSGAPAGLFGGAGTGGGAGAGGADAIIGQVAYVSGHTLYVTSAEGTTVKVTTSAASTVSKTVRSDVKGIHPGETVIVTGTKGANGAVSAETVRAGEAGASGSLGALFGGDGGPRRGSGSSGGGGVSPGSGSNGSGEPGRPGGSGFRRLNSPLFRQALAKYATCLRQNGIDIPPPNTTGKGPIFSIKGIDTASPRFKAATMRCRASLVSAFRRPQATAGSAGGGGSGAGGESSG
ncbi:MAG TPA: hypothetical protein VNX67_01775 [Solirubrobacteraceae bacterium]|jgi:hypothetical protein|nr:hypothetical protein [Solirubrobacteraceae bacterium]